MAFGNNESVPVGDWEGIEKCDSSFVIEKQTFSRHGAKWTGDQGSEYENWLWIGRGRTLPSRNNDSLSFAHLVSR
jgi:hypothetical protein